MKCLVAVFLMACVATSIAVINDDPFDHVGCFDESDGAVLDGGHKESGHDMEVQYCIGLCSGAMYYYAGLKNGNECHCGMDIRYSARPSSDCNVACTGKASQKCGGRQSIDVYRTGWTRRQKRDLPNVHPW